MFSPKVMPNVDYFIKTTYGSNGCRKVYKLNRYSTSKGFNAKYRLIKPNSYYKSLLQQLLTTATTKMSQATLQK